MELHMKNSWVHKLSIGLVAVSAVVASVGCMAGVQAQTVMDGYVYVNPSEIPPNIYSYPRAPYANGYAYWVYDRWYYPLASGWVSLTIEPAVLAPYRTQFYYTYGPRYVAPRYYYYGPQVYRPSPTYVAPGRPYYYRSGPSVVVPARPYYYRSGPAVVVPSRPYYAPAPARRSGSVIVIPRRR